MEKGSAWILIILIGVIITLGGYYYFGRSTNLPKSLNSPAPLKDNQETYSNLGFEFKYQKGLTVKEDTEEQSNKRGNGDFRKNFKGYVGYDPGKFLGAVAVLDEKNSYDTNPLTVWVFNNDNNLTVEEWYKNYWYYPFVWGDFTFEGKSKFAPKNEATISGVIAKSAVVDYQPGKPKFIYLAEDKKMYLFRIIGDTGDKILSAFKFIQ